MVHYFCKKIFLKIALLCSLLKSVIAMEKPELNVDHLTQCPWPVLQTIFSNLEYKDLINIAHQNKKLARYAIREMCKKFGKEMPLYSKENHYHINQEIDSLLNALLEHLPNNLDIIKWFYIYMSEFYYNKISESQRSELLSYLYCRISLCDGNNPNLPENIGYQLERFAKKYENDIKNHRKDTELDPSPIYNIMILLLKKKQFQFYWLIEYVCNDKKQVEKVLAVLNKDLTSNKVTVMNWKVNCLKQLIYLLSKKNDDCDSSELESLLEKLFIDLKISIKENKINYVYYDFVSNFQHHYIRYEQAILTYLNKIQDKETQAENSLVLFELSLLSGPDVFNLIPQQQWGVKLTRTALSYGKITYEEACKIVPSSSIRDFKPKFCIIL